MQTATVGDYTEMALYLALPVYMLLWGKLPCGYESDWKV